ncbi:hypothetical protein LTR37_012637 [Vermiconidia calcicola]|uniref:Uncharacterized protein n=1 Tax=Vermiconidia calcicola TaxID=1690605 RepID=A0ACC3MZ12_9PEZI|nr:hypothetical protein LTR37_012637 [Vermiconidia calcicola]
MSAQQRGQSRWKSYIGDKRFSSCISISLKRKECDTSLPNCVNGPLATRAQPSTRPPAPGTAPPQLPGQSITGETGSKTPESRRIVNAQASRASAAQGKITRIRNREKREGTVRDSGTIAPSLVEGRPRTIKSAAHRKTTAVQPKTTAGSSEETAQSKAERQQQLLDSSPGPYEPPGFFEDVLAAAALPGDGNGSRDPSNNASREQSVDNEVLRSSAQERPRKDKANKSDAHGRKKK